MRSQTLYEARWIFAILAALTILSLIFYPWLSILWGLLILYTFYFFRDPERPIPQDPRAVVAPADGVVSEVIEVEEHEVLKQRTQRIGIFLSVFDVHTNRAPVPGTVTMTHEKNGKYLDARHPNASTLNAYRTWAFQNGTLTVVVRQITGAIARRIVAWAKPGDHLARGERFGMIRFGSRTEVYLPLDAEILVQAGTRVRCGETVIARLADPLP